MYDIPRWGTNNCNYSDETVKTVKIGKKCCGRGNRKRNLKIWYDDSDNEIAITWYAEAHGIVKKRKRMLFLDEEKILIEEKWNVDWWVNKFGCVHDSCAVSTNWCFNWFLSR